MIVRGLSNTTTVVTQAEWSTVESLTDEARMLFHNFVDSVETRIVSLPSPDTNISITTVGEATAISTTDRVRPVTEIPQPGPFEKFISKLKALKNRRQLPREQVSMDLPKPIGNAQGISEIAAIFREVTQQPEFWRDLLKLT